MQFSAKNIKATTQKSDCLIIAITEGLALHHTAAELNKASNGYLLKTLKNEGFAGKFGQSLLLRDIPKIAAERILILGAGKPNELTEQGYRQLIQRAIANIGNLELSTTTSYLAEVDLKSSHDIYWKIRAQVEVTYDTLYRFTAFKSKKENPAKLRELTIAIDHKLDSAKIKFAINQGIAIGEASNVVKNLANAPSNVCTPSYIAKQAEKLAKNNKTHVKVYDEKDMRKWGMGALLAVSKGSKEEAKFIVVQYKGGKKDSKPYVLVGKGVTFDTGGISIKPAPNMDEMKYDMCGAATVLGALQAVSALKLPINVIGVIPTTENMPGGNATKPGDIVTTLSGQTVEILNTDAEGRLILCDALTYCERFDPKVVIDIATLTGAIIVALGNQAAGLFTNHEKLAQELLHASDQTGERLWRMPLWEEFGEGLQSNFADMANVGGREGGSSVAANFLSRFTKKYNWAHIDIAGVAWRSGRDKGATAKTLGLLVQWLINQAKVG